MTNPPGNSLETNQRNRVIDHGAEPLDALESLLERTRAEIDYNDAKGQNAYRLGMHDGLRYAEDAIVAILESHGRNPERIERPTDT